MRPDLYEPSVISALAPFVKKGATVVDVGAHVGLHTLSFSKLTGPRGRVIAIEPSPANASLLRRHTEWNDCRNVVVVEKAVSDQCGVARFCYRPDPTDPGGFANSLLYDIGGASKMVAVTTLDQLCRGSQADVLKIDVEGAELSVLLGATSILTQALPPVIMVAIHPDALRTVGVTPADVCRFLISLGYEGRNLRGEPTLDPAFEEIIFTKR
jgi:FkbM family methyltransferase